MAIQVVNLLENSTGLFIGVLPSPKTVHVALHRDRSREADKLDPSFFMQAVTSPSANFTPIASLRDH